MNYNNIEYILEFLDKCEFEERKLVLCNLQKKLTMIIEVILLG